MDDIARRAAGEGLKLSIFTTTSSSNDLSKIAPGGLPRDSYLRYSLSLGQALTFNTFSGIKAEYDD